LFDAIPPGIHRRIAGFFLWIHVAVSYAINSQAICASMDRIFFYQWAPVKGLKDNQRWMILTGIISVSAFVVANAIPFFKDLVAFIGALTSIPLTLLIPAVYHRKILGVPILLPTKDTLGSYSLLVFATVFMAAGLVGSVDSILKDWKQHQGGFFACH
jgi:amino acid permease